MTWKPCLGAVYLGDNKTLFRVWAPHAATVEVHLLTPADRRVPLARRGEYALGVVAGVPVGSRYLYCLDGRQERPDPASRCQPEGVHGPSQVVDLNFPWTDNQWLGWPLQDYIIYAVHVGT